MSENSFVALEHFLCPVCGVVHNHGAGILLNMKLKPFEEKNPVTGYALCEEHQTLYDNEYIALVEVTDHHNDWEDEELILEEAHRTGQLVHVKRDLVRQLLDINDEEELKHAMMFVTPDVIVKIKEIMVDQSLNTEVN